MKHFQKTISQQGFTLIETLIAILILALTIGALLTLTAGGFFSIRYAKNDIVANNLMQESLEFIRNTRDSKATEADATGIPTATWAQWIAPYQDAGCFDTGCTINIYAIDPADRIRKCDSSCDTDYMRYYTQDAGDFADQSFYAYQGNNIFDQSGTSTAYTTSFTRTITMQPAGGADPAVPGEVIITSTMHWMNGTNTKQVHQSIILSPWNLQ